MNNNALKIGLASAISFVTGYFVANWRNETFYFDRANEEVEVAREEIRVEFVDKLDSAEDRYEAAVASAAGFERAFRNLKMSVGENDAETADEEIQRATSAMMNVEAEQALKTYQGEGGFEPVDVHAFAPAEPVIQYSDYMTPEEPKSENKKSEDKKPTVQVLTTEEYMNDPMDYEQSTLLYYAEGDLLVGGRIDEGKVGETLRAQMLGDKNDVLKRPGLWEKEEVWYFRNHALKYDFEIMREEGKYVDEESSGVDG